MLSLCISKDTIHIRSSVSSSLHTSFPCVFENTDNFQIRTKNCMQYFYSHSSGPVQYKSKRYRPFKGKYPSIFYLYCKRIC